MNAYILILLFILFSLQNSFSQEIGGGEMNPGICTNQKSMNDFQCPMLMPSCGSVRE